MVRVGRVPRGFGGAALKGFRLAATLAQSWRRGSGGSVTWPRLREHEAQPHKSDQHQLGEKESGDHGKIPHTGGKIRVFSPVFRRRELAAR